MKTVLCASSSRWGMWKRCWLQRCSSTSCRSGPPREAPRGSCGTGTIYFCTDFEGMTLPTPIELTAAALSAHVERALLLLELYSLLHGHAARAGILWMLAFAGLFCCQHCLGCCETPTPMVYGMWEVPTLMVLVFRALLIASSWEPKLYKTHSACLSLRDIPSPFPGGDGTLWTWNQARCNVWLHCVSATACATKKKPPASST